jgi:transcriptional regulator with XRE-family HTH domain
MASPKLSNYLRANRKRLGLTQGEIAYLLGKEGGARVCRLERFVRDPSLEVALAFEAIFQKPLSELFAGLYHEIEQNVAARAEILAKRLDNHPPKPHVEKKRRTLAAIAQKKAKRNHS